MFRPLTFLEIEPAILTWCFCGLDPRSKVYLCLGPWFLQKTPRNSVFLIVKPLDLVLSLVFAF